MCSFFFYYSESFIAEIMVLIEKNPNAKTVSAEKIRAKTLRYFSCLTKETTATIATTKKIIPKTICSDIVTINLLILS